MIQFVLHMWRYKDTHERCALSSLSTLIVLRMGKSEKEKEVIAMFQGAIFLLFLYRAVTSMASQPWKLHFSPTPQKSKPEDNLHSRGMNLKWASMWQFGDCSTTVISCYFVHRCFNPLVCPILLCCLQWGPAWAVGSYQGVSLSGSSLSFSPTRMTILLLH